MTVFSLHISATLHLTIFGIWSDNIQSVQYMICFISYGILGWQYDTQYELLRIYVHHDAPFCVLTIKRHCLPRGWPGCRASLAELQLSIIRLLQYDWLSGYWWVMITLTCAMENRFLNIYSTFYGRQIIIQMVVVSIFRCLLNLSWKEKKWKYADMK